MRQHKTVYKLMYVCQSVVLFIRPLKHMTFVYFFIVVCVIPGVIKVAQDKQLSVPEQSCEIVSSVPFHLVEGFVNCHTTTFQFYLYDRQTINQDCHIVTTFIFVFYTNLICHLEFIFTPCFRVEELQV